MEGRRRWQGMSPSRRPRLATQVAALPLLSAALLTSSAAAATTSVQGEAMSLPSSQGRTGTDSSAVGGKALIIWSNGTATGSISGAADTVSVRARGDQCGGAPQMTVTVDGRQVLSVAVPATMWTDYAAPAALATGTHQLAIAFTNDYSSSSCDRNLYVDQVTLSQVAPPPPAAGGVEAETMSLPAASGHVTSDTTASGGRSMLIWSNDSATTTVTLPTATTVTVRARGDQCGGAPQLAVTVDGRPVLSAAVPATTWSDYTAPAAVSAGSHAVAVSFTNDYLDSSCDRNLYVDRLTFSSTAPTPTSGVPTRQTGWWWADLAGIPSGVMGGSTYSGTTTANALNKQWNYWDVAGGSVSSIAAEGLAATPWGGSQVVKWHKPQGDNVNVYQKLNRTFTREDWPAGAPGAPSTGGTGSPPDVSARYISYQYLPSAKFHLNPGHSWVILNEFKENLLDANGTWHQDATWALLAGYSGTYPMRLVGGSHVGPAVPLSRVEDRWVKFEYRLYQGARDTTGHGGRIELYIDDKLFDTGYESELHVGSKSSRAPDLAHTQSFIWIAGQYTSNESTLGVPDSQYTDVTSYVGLSTVLPLP